MKRLVLTTLLFIANSPTSLIAQERNEEKYFNALKLSHATGCLHLENKYSGDEIGEFIARSAKALGLTMSEFTKYLDEPSFDKDLNRLFDIKGGRKGCKNAVAFFESMRKKWNNEKKPIEPEVNPHDKCKDSRDYEGCMKFQSSRQIDSAIEDDCTGQVCFIKKRGADVYGLPKPIGWMSYQADDGRLFYMSKTYRVPHKGDETRYVAMKRITRYYQTPKGGSSGTFIGGSSASTNCTGYEGTVNCTTTGSSPTYIPGSAGTPGGVSNTAFVSVYDCKEGTNAAYKNNRLWIRWKKEESGVVNRLLKDECDKGTRSIKELPILEVKM